MLEGYESTVVAIIESQNGTESDYVTGIMLDS